MDMKESYEEAKSRMLQKYASKKDLFYYNPCIIPAWEPLIDEIIELIEEWNDNCNGESKKLRIFQMKEKFGSFITYLEPMPVFPATGDSGAKVPNHMQDAVNAIANKGIKICRICGATKIQTVIETRLQWRCLDHWDKVSYFQRRNS